MKSRLRYALVGLTLIGAVFAAGCGASGSGGNGNTENMGGMDHSGMDHSGMDHSEMDMSSMVSDESGEYSDEAFIDAMVPHHVGAIEMAEAALENAEHEEIRELAGGIIVAQDAEIEELRKIKEAEFGTSEIPMEMSDEDMRMMGMSDPMHLAGERPFDRAFIDAMIPHHESAVQMANVAAGESENPEIKALAKDIIDAQTREIEQLRAWREEWYPAG